jgi:hypothetical protein
MGKTYNRRNRKEMHRSKRMQKKHTPGRKMPPAWNHMPTPRFPTIQSVRDEIDREVGT